MLNINKFQSEMVLKIEVEKIIHTWNDNEGIGKFVNYLSLDGKKVYISVDKHADITIKNEVITFIKENYNYGEGSQYDIFNSTLMYNVIEDENCNVASIEDEDNLYICDYTVSLSLNGISLDEEDLQEIF